MKEEYEAICVHVLDRRVTYYGVFLNTYGGKSRLLTGHEIIDRLGRGLRHIELGPDIKSVLRENRVALFETEQQARQVTEMLKEGRRR